MPITALPAPPSRQDATNFATRADTFMTALPVFATEANTLQTDVNTKQTAAASSATAAAASATNSANSATGSASSATAAATSATNSANSATGASTSKTGADNTLASFTQRYLGAKSVEPTLDNTGAALLTGALYFDTVIGGGTLRVWGGLAWANLPATTAAAIANTPAGSITETNVQGALNGLGTRKVETSINLAAGTNLNSVVTSGFYRMLGTPVNGPTGVGDSQLIVSRGLDTIAQISINYSSGIVYVRTGSPPDVGGASAWGNWIQQATTADVALKANKGANTDITSLAGLTTALSIAQGGTGAVTANAAADALGAFRRGTLLGTVSQAAGVPTGAIIERGSNANGEYVRFADGTLLCHVIYTGAVSFAAGSVAGLMVALITLTSPSVSVIDFTPFGGGNHTNGEGWATVSYVKSATQVVVSYFSPTSAPSSIGTSLRIAAIGRWY